MTDKAVSALTSLTGSGTATGDLLYIVDISEASAADRSKKITAEELQNYMKKFPATIGVGAATPAASGAGISFPATQSASSDANTLDDYEEGNWTPTLTSGGGTITAYTVNFGKYTKVGRMAHICCKITVSDIGTAFGAALITLPITSASESIAVGRESAATGYILIASIGDTSNAINVYDGRSANGNAFVGGNGMAIMLSATYLV